MSLTLSMAWRNIWRNPRRTALTMAAVAFAGALLVFMLSWQVGAYDAMIDSSVRIHTGHLQVMAKGFNKKQDIRRVVPKPEEVEAILKNIPEIEAFSCRADAGALISSKDRTYGVMVVGIDPVREAEVSTIKTMIRKGEYLSGRDDPGVLVGELLARNLKVGLGDELTLLGQGRDGSIAASVFKVKGIYSTGLDEFDRSTINISLGNFQDIFEMMGAVHKVVIMGRRLSDNGLIKKKISAALEGLEGGSKLEVLTWDELTPGLKQVIQMDLFSGIIFYIILILVVAFSILNTFLMAVFERTREFGVMMAIGTTPGRLTRLLLVESMTMTIIGVALGMVIGVLVTWYVQIYGIDISGASELLAQYGISGRMYARLTPLTLFGGPAAVLVITSLAALYPALKVRGLTPIKALTHT